MPDASPMDPTDLPEWVRENIEVAKSTCEDPVRDNTHDTIVWLADALRTALADTRRVKWIRQNVCEITTRDSEGYEECYDDDCEGDDGIIDVVDALMEPYDLTKSKGPWGCNGCDREVSEGEIRAGKEVCRCGGNLMEILSDAAMAATPRET